MDFIDNINEETLIVCQEGQKENIILHKKFKNIKIITFNEFIKKIMFDYDEKAIIYIMNNYNVKYEIALMYLKNIYYIKNKEYNIKKLDFLRKIRLELDEKNLLIYNEGFKDYIKKIKIIFYDIEIETYFLELLKDINYKIIVPEYKEYNHKIIEFNTIEEEIEFIAYKISELIYSGINIENIKLANVDSSYYFIIDRIFSLHNLKVNIPYKSPLSSYKYIKNFIEIYKNSSLEEALEKIDTQDELYNKLINVINKYIKYDNKELIIKKINQEHINNKEYINSIKIIDYMNYVSNDEDYVFMIGFNDTLIPKSIKDIEYITDNIKEFIPLEDTKIKNIKLRENIIKKIKNIKNLYITYKLQDNKTVFYPSTLCQNFEVEKNEIDYRISYSEKYNKIKLTKSIDEYIKYGSKNKEFNKLYSNFEIKYNSFSNEYQKINRIMDKLTLSYSKMNVYNKCAFRYYLSEILKIDIFEENFSTVIGSMVHYTMEKCLRNKDYEIETHFNEFLKDKTFTNKEKFFLEKYKKAITNLLNQVKNEHEYMSLSNAMYEKTIIVEYGKNIKFKGIIDKILYEEINNKTILAIIDYKTGKDDISLKYLKEGIDIQLPIYLYLSNHLNLKNVIYGGFYLQRLNINDEDYRLEGYSNSDKEILENIDNNYESSKIIKGMKTNKDGSFGSYTKVLNNEEIDKIINITKKIIEKVIENIKNNNFKINPKKTNKELLGCEFCKFKDICFVKNNDYKEISETSLEEL